MRKKIIALCIMFSIVIAVSFLVARLFTHVSNDTKSKDTTDKIEIITSFYPMYIIALNITDNVDNVILSNLTPNQTGCLHDYQFSTSDMKKLENADAFIINGGGMEGFLLDVTNQYPKLDIIDSSIGIDFLSESDDEKNAHAWLNTNYYITQINNICNGLCALDSKNKDIYSSNAKNYIKKICNIQDKISTIQNANNEGVIIFHDAFAYLADEIGLKVLASVEIEGDSSSLSAGEIADIIDEMKDKNIQCIFIEKQFNTSIANAIAKATNSTVYVMDSIVTGDNNKDAYLNAMNYNIETIQKIPHK